MRVHESPDDLALDAARTAREHLLALLVRKSSAAVILATGNSQIRFLDELIRLGGVDWSRLTLFHMDEYLGISARHKGSFRHYLHERVEKRVRPGQFHYIEGDALEPLAECKRYAGLLREQPIDLCFLGIGENGHIAFNDPPVADFEDPLTVKLVKLDDACKMQQVKEGHFPDIETVPPYAITLTIPALCSAEKILCLASGKHKAAPVRAALEGPIQPDCPASILRRQPHATLFLDREAASELKES